MDSLWLENCLISQSFEPSRGRVAKVLVQKLLRAVEAEKQGLKNRVWPHVDTPTKIPPRHAQKNASASHRLNIINSVRKSFCARQHRQSTTPPPF